MPPKHTPPDCSQAETISRHGQTLDRIEQALFRGNGKPSILSQLEVGNEKFNEIDKKLERIQSYGRSIVFAILGLIGTTAWDMFQKHTAETYNFKNKMSEVSK